MSKVCQIAVDRTCPLCGAAWGVAQNSCSDSRCDLSPCQLCDGPTRLEVFQPLGGAQAVLVLCDGCGAEWRTFERPSDRPEALEPPSLTDLEVCTDVPF